MGFRKDLECLRRRVRKGEKLALEIRLQRRSIPNGSELSAPHQAENIQRMQRLQDLLADMQRIPGLMAEMSGPVE